MGCKGLKFGSLDEVMKVDNLMCLCEGKGVPKEKFMLCLERGKDQGGQCSSKVAANT